jgi:hypothetical protein
LTSFSLGIGDALKRLGFKIYDFQAASTRYERDFPLWVEAAFLRHEGRPYNKSDFDKLIGNYDAVVGVPTSFFYEEFVKLYPNVKVILVTRDPDPDLIKSFVQRTASKFWQRLDTVYYRNINRLLKLNAKSDNYFCMEDDQIVRENVRERNLLEIHNLIAWVPLCEFLGVKVPADAPAPELHNNTTKAEFAAHPWRAASGIAKRAGVRTVMSLTYILTMASVTFVSTMAAVLGGAGLHQLFSTSIRLVHLLAVRSQIRDTMRLAAAGLALLTFVCGIGAGYAVALMRIPEPVVLESSPGDHRCRNNNGRRRGGGRGRGKQQENGENKRPERPTLDEWSGVQENIRRDDAEMVKKGRSTFEEWKNGKHVTFHVIHKQTENGQDLYSGPRKVLSITEETVE